MSDLFKPNSDDTEVANKIQLFSSIKEQITTLGTQCTALVISDDDSLESAKKLAKEAGKINTAIETKRKELTAPYLENKRKIDEFAKDITGTLEKSIKLLRKNILDFELEKEKQRQLELQRIEEEKRKAEAIRQAEEEARQKAIKEAEANNTPPPPVYVAPPSVPSIANLRMDQREKELKADKSKSIRTVWKFEIIDANLLPREYLMPDEKKIGTAMALGTREIPGVRIFEDQLLHLR